GQRCFELLGEQRDLELLDEPAVRLERGLHALRGAVGLYAGFIALPKCDDRLGVLGIACRIVRVLRDTPLQSPQIPREVRELGPWRGRKESCMNQRIALRSDVPSQTREGSRQRGDLLRKLLKLRRDGSEHAKRALGDRWEASAGPPELLGICTFRPRQRI